MRRWRTVGIGGLGLVGGVLLALVVQDVLAPLLVREPGQPTGLGMLLGLLLPALAGLGVVVAIALDRRGVGRRDEPRGAERRDEWRDAGHRTMRRPKDD